MPTKAAATTVRTSVVTPMLSPSTPCEPERSQCKRLCNTTVYSPGYMYMHTERKGASLRELVPNIATATTMMGWSPRWWPVQQRAGSRRRPRSPTRAGRGDDRIIISWRWRAPRWAAAPRLTLQARGAGDASGEGAAGSGLLRRNLR
eukprot:scaffold1685_cov390-Prasinococcus_capsulatus_cf.AAC.5